MDGKQFDTVIKNIGVRPGSRRAVLRALGGGALGAVLARLGLDGAAAQTASACGRVGAECSDGGQCCPGSRCAKGRCRCRAGLTDCGGRCRNLQTDVINCGACGSPCSKGQACCAGQCRDLRLDNENCGVCGNACPASRGFPCCNGRCQEVLICAVIDEP